MRAKTCIVSFGLCVLHFGLLMSTMAQEIVNNKKRKLQDFSRLATCLLLLLELEELEEEEAKEAQQPPPKRVWVADRFLSGGNADRMTYAQYLMLRASDQEFRYV